MNKNDYNGNKIPADWRIAEKHAVIIYIYIKPLQIYIFFSFQEEQQKKHQIFQILRYVHAVDIK